MLKKILLFFMLSPFAYSSDSSISIAFTFSMPPYLSHDMNSGIERDIIVKALQAGGFTLGHIHNVHYKRAIMLLEQKVVDAIASNMSNTVYDQLKVKPQSSMKTIDYVDCAITYINKPTKEILKLTSIADYADKVIWAFKTAQITLGPAFQKMAKSNKDYTEDTDQTMQAAMLALGRVDIAISDRNIFTSKLIQDNKYQVKNFEFQTLGKPTPRTLRFRNPEYLERFDLGLAKVKQDGTYQNIIKKYQHSYATSCD